MSKQKSYKGVKYTINMNGDGNMSSNMSMKDYIINNKISEKNKYYYLFTKGKNVGVLNSRMTNYNPESSIIICDKTDDNHVYSIVNIDDFGKLDRSRNIHEIILGHVPRLMMFDIDVDCSMKTSSGSGSGKKVNKAESEKIYNSIVSAWREYSLENGIGVYYVVATRHRRGKYSWHVICPSVYCVNAAHMKEVLLNVRDRINPASYRNYLDICVANNNSSMSMIGFSNKGYKLSIDNKYNAIPVDVDEKEPYSLTCFYTCLKQMLPGGEKYKIEKKDKDIENVYETVDEKWAVNYDKIARGYISDIMDNHYIRDVHNNIINYNRLHSSYCESCMRYHDNDNTFRIVKYGASLYWFCLKDENKNKVYICDVNENQNDCKSGKKRKVKKKNAVVSHIKKLIDGQTWLSKRTVIDNEIKRTGKVLRDINDDNYDIIAIKAAKGMGKTKKVIDFINKNISCDSSIGSIVFRKTLASNLTSRLNKKLCNSKYCECDGDKANIDEKENKKCLFVDYQTVNKGYIDSNRWVCQMESLPRIRNMKVDYLIIDEFNQVVRQMYSSTVHNIRDVYARFKGMIKAASKIIILDADLSNQSIQWIKELRGEVNNRIKIEHYYYTHQYKMSMCYDEDKTLQMAMSDLSNGKNIAIACNRSRNYIKYLALMLANPSHNNNNVCGNSDNSGGEKKNDINEKKNDSIINGVINGEKKILIICQDTIEDVGYTLNDVDKYWSQYDCVIYSPSVQSGVSYEKENYFDTVYGFFGNNTNSYNDCSQMLHRVRSKKNIIVNIKLFPVSYLPVTEEELEEYISISREDIIVPNMIDREENMFGYEYTNKNSYYKIWLGYQCDKNKSMSSFIYNFMKSEAQQGAKINLIENDSVDSESVGSANKKINSDNKKVDSDNKKVDSKSDDKKEEKKIKKVVVKKKNSFEKNKVVIKNKVKSINLQEILDNDEACYNIKRIYNMEDDIIHYPKNNDVYVETLDKNKKKIINKPKNKKNNKSKSKKNSKIEKMNVNTWYEIYGNTKVQEIYKNLNNIYHGLENIRLLDLEKLSYLDKQGVEVNAKYEYTRHRLALELLKVLGYDDIYDDKLIERSKFIKDKLKNLNTFFHNQWKYIIYNYPILNKSIKKKTFKSFGELRYAIRLANIILYNIYGLKVSGVRNSRNNFTHYKITHYYYGALFNHAKYEKIIKDDLVPVIGKKSRIYETIDSMINIMTLDYNEEEIKI